MTPVSIIMAAYRAEGTVERAIRSVQTQTFSHWQLLVIDDCSDDGTAATVARLAREDPRIVLLRNAHNLGAAGSRNLGIDRSRSKYIAFLDSDDLWEPQKLELQLAALERTGAGLCCTSYGIMDAEGNPSKKDFLVPEKLTFSRLLRENLIGCSTVLLRREALGARRFHTGYLHEDYALWLELVRSGVCAVGCPQVLARWRYAAGSRSADKRKSAAGRWKIYREHLRLPLPEAAFYFVCYALSGIRKYFR